MAIATPGLTYEDYLCGPEEMRRYDILDGEKVYMPDPTMRHQRINFDLARALSECARRTHRGLVIQAPCDVLIRRRPLRTRQPDVLFISAERLGGRSLDDPSPLEPAPELVVEILSAGDTKSTLSGKLADYRNVGVLECWLVSPHDQTVEVLRFSGDEFVRGVFSGWERRFNGLSSQI